MKHPHGYIARYAALLAPIALTAAPALAQNDPTDLPGAEVLREEAAAQDRTVFVAVRGGAKGLFEADFKDEDGSISTYYLQSGVDLSWKASDTLRLNFGLGYEAAFYDIDGGREVFPELDENDPFDTLHSVSLAASGQWYFSDPWYAVGAAFATAGWEPGADFGEAWVYGGFGGIGYRFSDRFTLALGAGGTTRLEDDATFYPFISLRWNATDDLTVETEGLGVRVTSRINDAFDAYFRGGYEGRAYRLDEDRDSEPSAVLEDRGVYVALGVGWTPIPGLRVSLEGGAVVYRELELRDSSGDDLSEEEAEIAPYAGIGIRYAF
jgi:hypothetical protein